MPETPNAGATDLPLAAEFSAASHETWLKLVDKVLGGTPFDKKLVSRTYDGLTIQPLYTRGDWPADGDPSGYPGLAPFTRGGAVLGSTVAGWDIRQSHGHPDPEVANRQILEDLDRGVGSIVLRVDPSGARGVCIRSRADLDTALRDVLLDLAPLTLESAGPALPAAATLLALLDARGIGKEAFAGNFGIDPLRELAANGTLLAPLEVELARAADVASHVARSHAKARALQVSTLVHHSAGCAEAQELGLALATAVAYLRALTRAGLDVDAACGQIAFTLAADADMILTIAKLRAFRRLWSRVTEVCGAGIQQRSAPLTACSAPRMMSRRDPWVNILRTTVACFAAGLGGADAVTVLPFDHALGVAQPLARRIARNTHIVLQEESNVARVIDPAGGAWAFEHLTDELATAGWAFFQKIERAGGMASALVAGLVAAEIAPVRAARTANIARRKDALTGVSEFPDLHERQVEVETVDLPAIVARRAPATGKVGALPAAGDGRLTASLVEAARGDAGVAALTAALTADLPATTTALPQVRLTEPFERLRDAGDAYKAKHGAWPQIFLASIGTLADFTARAAFAKNFYEAGGIEALPGAGGTDPATIAAEYQRSGASLAVLCGPDALYAAHGVAVAKALKDAGAGFVQLAGRGGELESALRAAGVDGFIFMGCDVVAVLADVHRHLETA